jgi:Lhr-like helicase
MKIGSKQTLRAIALEMMILKASMVLMDSRTVWPRALKRLFKIIEEHDPRLVHEQKRLRAEPYAKAIKTRYAIDRRWPR